MNFSRAIALILLASSTLSAAEIVEVTATLVRVKHPEPHQLSQIELRKEVLVARTGGEEDLLKLSAVVESGQWATIKRGREFWYPNEYSEARVHQAVGDDGSYSILKGVPAPGSDTIIIPNSPTKMEHIELGAFLQVRPTVKEDGLIYLEGRFRDTVFEGLSEEAIPIKVETKQLVPQSRVHDIMLSRIDKPLFRKVDEEFGVMLPFSPGTSVNAKKLREAQSKYTYFVPFVLGNTAFGAPGKIEFKEENTPPGPIIATVMKATMVKDFFIRKKAEDTRRENGVLILEVKKIDLPETTPFRGRGEKRVYLTSKFVESEKPGAPENPVMSEAKYQAVLKDITKRKGADLLSGPSIVVQPGQSGKIEVVREFVFPSEYAPPSLNPLAIESGSVFPVVAAAPTRNETRDVGVTLQIKTTLEEGDMIRMNVKTSIMAFEGFLDFGNPVMALKSGMIKKLKPLVASENKVEMPVFPFRSTETEFLVPNGSHVAMTMIFDYHNTNHQTDRFLPFRKAKVEEVKTPRYLTVYLSPKILDLNGVP